MQHLAESYPRGTTCWAAAKLISYVRIQSHSYSEVRLHALPIFPFAYLRGAEFCASAVATLAPTYGGRSCFASEDLKDEAECLLR